MTPSSHCGTAARGDEDAAAEIAERSPDETAPPHPAAARRRSPRPARATPTSPTAIPIRTCWPTCAACGLPRRRGGAPGLRCTPAPVWQVETYGFHLTEREVRQHSAVHRKVLDELVPATRAASDREVLEVFRSIRYVQERFGPARAAVHRVVHPVGAGSRQRPRARDLRGGPRRAASRARRHPRSSRHLRPAGPPRHPGRDRVRTRPCLPVDATRPPLEVMLGYSTPRRTSAPSPANLRLYEAQAKISTSGPGPRASSSRSSRSGGALGAAAVPRANSAILAQPPHSVDGRFKLTEQGEVIFARYGDPDIAMRQSTRSPRRCSRHPRSIERRNAVPPTPSPTSPRKMTWLARSASFALVKAPGFAPWFATVTTMEELGHLALGPGPPVAASRSSRSKTSAPHPRPVVFRGRRHASTSPAGSGSARALDAVGDARVSARHTCSGPLFTPR